MHEIEEEIEQGLMLVGSTAIENKLQEKVEKTIYSLKEAGIKVWMLTGDKIQTAINIGTSCGLLGHNMRQYVMKTTLANEIKD